MRNDATQLKTNCEGTIAVEYLILVGFVGVVVAVAIIALGLPLLHQYRFMQLVIASPAT